MDQTLMQMMKIYKHLNQDCKELSNIRKIANPEIQEYLRSSEVEITEAMADIENAMTKMSKATTTEVGERT